MASDRFLKLFTWLRETVRQAADEMHKYFPKHQILLESMFTQLNSTAWLRWWRGYVRLYLLKPTILSWKRLAGHYSIRYAMFSISSVSLT